MNVPVDAMKGQDMLQAQQRYLFNLQKTLWVRVIRLRRRPVVNELSVDLGLEYTDSAQPVKVYSALRRLRGSTAWVLGTQGRIQCC